MRTYTIDQLRDEDTAALIDYLDEAGLKGSIDGIYWLPVPQTLLTPIQKEHQDSCGPYCLALEVDEQALHLELLVRGLGRITCACVGFASEPLRDHMIAFVEDVLKELTIAF